MKPKQHDPGRRKDLISTLVLLGSILILFASHYTARYIIFKQHGHGVTDRVTESVMARPARKVYTRTRVNYFYPGDTMSSQENGKLILWDSTMSRDLIVGFVTDSGTFEVYSE